MTESNPATDSSEQPSLKLFLPLLAAVVAIVPLAVDMYLPAMPAIAEALNSDMSLMQLTLSLFLGGYAAGLLFFGPMADIFGRRPLVLIGLSGFAIVSFLLSQTESVGWFLFLRLFQAFIGSAATVPVPGYIKAIYGQNMAKGMSYVSMIMMIAPMIAPTIGIVLLQLSGWPLIFMVLGGYALLMFLVAITALPKASSKPLEDSLFNTFFKSYSVVLSTQSVRRYIYIICCSTLIFFGYLTAVSHLYMEVYKVTEKMFGLLFAINVSIFMLSSFLNTRLVTRFGSLNMLKGAWALGVFAAIGLLTVNLLGLHLYWTVAFLAFLLSGSLIISVNADALILLQFTEKTGTATGVIGTLRFGIGALAGPILAFFYDGSAMPFCYLMLAAMTAITLVLLLTSNQLENP